MSPGTSPAGTLASVASLTVVEAQIRSMPRRGKVTSVVAVPDVIAPLEAIIALPFETWSAPVTIAALPGSLLSRDTIAIEPLSADPAGAGTLCVWTAWASVAAPGLAGGAVRFCAARYVGASEIMKTRRREALAPSSTGTLGLVLPGVACIVPTFPGSCGSSGDRPRLKRSRDET